MIMDCHKIKPLKNIDYRINEYLKCVFDHPAATPTSNPSLIFVFEKTLMIVDPESHRSKIKRQFKNNIAKIVNLSDDLAIAIC